MSTDSVRRLAIVVAGYGAGAASPPGVDPSAFAVACLADSYEVVAGLVGVTAAIAGEPPTEALLWPGDHRLARLRSPGWPAGRHADRGV